MKDAYEVKEKDNPNLLRSLKEDVTAWFTYWNENIKIFHKSNNFLYYSNLSQQEENALNSLQRPTLEFNISEAYVSRLIGEFSKQEPSFSVHENPDNQLNDPRLTNFLEGYLAFIAEESKKEGTETATYKDMLSGGYSVAEVFYEYSSPTSFNQNIKFRKLNDPTMSGFDPLAQDIHKGDGRCYFRIFPMTKKEFVRNYPKIDISGLNFNSSNVGNFSFSYKAKNEDIIAVCVYYGKKITKKKIVYLSNNTTMSLSAYNKMIKEWNDNDFIEQPPEIKKTRLTDFTEIIRYDFIDNQIIEITPTLYSYLPGVFFDGNSHKIRYNEGQDDLKQTVRPYWKNAEGAQRLKNLAGQTLANEIESLVNHKFKVPKEGIPPGYEQYYINNQKAGVLVYNGFMPDGITPIAPPQEIVRPPIPGEVAQTFMACDQVIQNVLGSYDASLGINDNQLSGVAIQEAATQSNAAAMPYVINYMTSFTQIAKIIVGLIPKVIKNPRKLSIINNKKQKTHIDVNGEAYIDSNRNIVPPISMDFEHMMLNVLVEASTNFEVQKNKALQMLDMLSKSFPAVQQLINTKGLPILFDNLSFKGSDQLKQLAEEMIEESQQKAKMQPPLPNPVQLKQQELQQQAMKQQQDYQIGMGKLNNERMKMAVDTHLAGREDAIDIARMQTEKEVHHSKETNELVKSAAKIMHEKEKSHQELSNNIVHEHYKNIANNQPSVESKLTTAPENPNH